MTEPGLHRFESHGTLYGSLAGLLFAIFVGFVVFVGSTLGDCFDECDRGPRLSTMLGIVLLLAALLGFSVRSLVRWFEWRRYAGGQGRPPIWALLVAPPLILIAAWCAPMFLIFLLGFAA